MIGHSVLPGRFRQSRLLLCTAAAAVDVAAAAAAAARALTKSVLSGSTARDSLPTLVSVAFKSAPRAQLCVL